MLASRRCRMLVVTLAISLLGFGLWQLGGAAKIHAKAWLAQILLKEAWIDTLAGADAARPWPWADTFPVARLTVPRQGLDQIILAGASGRSLAFGPGHLDGTVLPGAAGHSVVSGHRDTHFGFLAEMQSGDEVRLQRRDGVWQSYRVTGSEVVDVANIAFSAGDQRPALTLVTCYPFDAIDPGGPQRYLVFAEGIEDTPVVDEVLD